MFYEILVSWDFSNFSLQKRSFPKQKKLNSFFINENCSPRDTQLKIKPFCANKNNNFNFAFLVKKNINKYFILWNYCVLRFFKFSSTTGDIWLLNFLYIFSAPIFATSAIQRKPNLNSNIYFSQFVSLKISCFLRIFSFFFVNYNTVKNILIFFPLFTFKLLTILVVCKHWGTLYIYNYNKSLVIQSKMHNPRFIIFINNISQD